MDILIVGETDSANLGDQAIHVTLRRLFESQGHRVRGWDLSRGRYSRRDDAPGAGSPSAAGSGRLKAQLVAAVERAPNAVQRLAILASRKRAFLERRRQWIEVMRRHDLVVFGGGALLMDNNWSFPLGLVHAARAVRDAGRPYVCIGCSTGSRFSRPAKRWLKEFLDGCLYIALRDHLSLDGLAMLGDFDAAVYADSALSLASVCPRAAAPDGRRVGINVISPVLSARLGVRFYEAYLDELAQFVCGLGDDGIPGFCEVVLFSTGEPRDLDAAHELHARAGLGGARVPVRVQPGPESLETLVTTIAAFDLVISTRMHAGIIAKSYGVPLIAVGWDRKIRGFCEMIGIEADYFDVEVCRAQDLLRAAERLQRAGFEQPDRVQERLSELAALPGRLAELIESAREP